MLAYYARMFLAREAEQLGAIAQARASYEKAAQLYPRAQSVFVALSQLAGREGDMPRARQALLRGLALAEAPDNAEDPWWQYSTFAGRTADALLADARAALIRDGER